MYRLPVLLLTTFDSSSIVPFLTFIDYVCSQYVYVSQVAGKIEVIGTLGECPLVVENGLTAQVAFHLNSLKICMPM